MKRLTEYQIMFDKAESDNSRSSILRFILLNIAKELNLITKNKNVINVIFEEMDCAGYFLAGDTNNVYLDISYTEKGASINSAISTYLHECAHLLVHIRDYDCKHAFLFYAVNLAINIKFDQLLKEVDPDFLYFWTSSSLRMYNIYEDQYETRASEIDYEKLSSNLALSTKIAFKYSQNNNKTVNQIIKKICSEYDKKINTDALESKKIRKIKNLIVTFLARLYMLCFCFLTIKTIMQ